MVGSDGLKVTVGDASVQIVTMPGHTPGTLSYLFEVRDNGKPLRVAYVGGTAIPFNASAAYYDGYISSSKKMAPSSKPTARQTANRAMRIHSMQARTGSHATSAWSRIAPQPQRFGRRGDNRA